MSTNIVHGVGDDDDDDEEDEEEETVGYVKEREKIIIPN